MFFVKLDFDLIIVQKKASDLETRDSVRSIEATLKRVSVFLKRRSSILRKGCFISGGRLYASNGFAMLACWIFSLRTKRLNLVQNINSRIKKTDLNSRTIGIIVLLFFIFSCHQRSTWNNTFHARRISTFPITSFRWDLNLWINVYNIYIKKNSKQLKRLKKITHSFTSLSAKFKTRFCALDPLNIFIYML